MPPGVVDENGIGLVVGSRWSVVRAHLGLAAHIGTNLAPGACTYFPIARSCELGAGKLTPRDAEENFDITPICGTHFLWHALFIKPSSKLLAPSS